MTKVMIEGKIEGPRRRGRRLEGVEWRLDDGKVENGKGEGRVDDGCAGLGTLPALTVLAQKKKMQASCLTSLPKDHELRCRAFRSWFNVSKQCYQSHFILKQPSNVSRSSAWTKESSCRRQDA